MDTLSRYLLPIGALIATLICWTVLALAQKLWAQRTIKTKHSPAGQSGASIMPEGQSALEALGLRVRMAWSAVAGTPVIYCATFWIAQQTQSVALGAQAIALFIVSGLALWGLTVLYWRQAVARQRREQWEITARQMVDRAIGSLEQRGYSVLRDFTLDKVKIDYLMIGPKGVFTMHAVAYPIPTSSDQLADATVTYDGRTLFFPNEKDQLSIESAQTGVEIFSEWLSEQLGTPIAARAILALPGWQIKRISAEGISVIHPGQLEALFQYVKARPLTPELIRQIEDLIQRQMGKPHNSPNPSTEKETTITT
ncbi:MAG: hypothetical protein M0036_05600 [Desulfobacteraceae bacterium]|nr:hypothetical protein [Desulfobacteraceae bacterium]